MKAASTSRRFLGLGVGREERAVAVVAAAADEEHLHAGLAGGLPGGDHVGVLQAGRVHHVVALHEGQRADAVAHRGGVLEFQRLGGLLHLGGEFLLHGAGLAGEERLRLADQLAVVRLARSGRRRAPSSGGSGYSRQGRVRLANTVSAQERSRNTRCIAVTVWLTAQAEANGPQ